MLKRNKALLFAGGVWVFPGGAMDPEDWREADTDENRAARVAAAREAKEEAGLIVDPELMLQISHWTTPEAEPKRFYTWFFLVMTSGDSSVEIDGGEIHDYQWINITEAVRRHDAGDFGLLPPTIMTLRSLLGYMSAEDAMIGIAARDPFTVLPVFSRAADVVQVLFEGDAGYGSGDAGLEGARHRASLVDGAWQYQHQGLEGIKARLDS
jgi:8-oxo-dGTP pyrophosphatase MutT (NUDIX family)